MEEKPNSSEKGSDAIQPTDSYADAGTVQPQNTTTTNVTARLEMSRKLLNPLEGLSSDELKVRGRRYAEMAGLTDDETIRVFELGAQLAADQQPGYWDKVEGLSAEETSFLEREETHKWSQPRTLYAVIAICSLCAAVQGMDETVVNGAQSFYKRDFNIGSTSSRDTWLLGLTNGAPYLCCAVLGCWLTEPMNRLLGRRGTLFWTCVISAITCLAQAFVHNWYTMFITRFLLGLGLGPKSSTTPVFAAECAPPRLRGALVMQWQVWTAFGIMIGYVAGIALHSVHSDSIDGLNWRLMVASAMIPAIITCCFVYFAPESPRFYMLKNRYDKAYFSMRRLRATPVLAARDVYYAYALLEAERETLHVGKQNRLKEFFTVRRNRNAMMASEIVMFMQQFCGVNVIAYYSTEIFLQARFSEVSALAASLGFGLINFFFALPAFYTIDTFGRRNLLLTTFPAMSLCLLFTGFSFWIEGEKARTACIALGIYLFGIFYSPGEGPVPFTYSAEAYPLYIRSIGMSLATATTWFFNFVLAVTWPSMLSAFKPQGAFGWYAAWNIIGFLLVLFLLPETKAKTLEELDAVFDVPVSSLIKYGKDESNWFVQRKLLRRDVVKPRPPMSDAILHMRDSKPSEV